MLKKILRWLIIGGTLFFVIATLKHHWENVTSVRIEPRGWWYLSGALVVTSIAHIWSAWVWTWILKSFRQPMRTSIAIGIYLVTNLGKYLPGNVGHFYARIVAVNKIGTDWATASLSVLLEPLLMAAAALSIASIAGSLGWMKTTSGIWLNILILIAILVGIQPRILNIPIRFLNRAKKLDREPVYVENYPIVPLLGEIGFVLLRGGGFILVWMALQTAEPSQIFPLLGAFSFAWLLGLIVPGAPGGLGVFEATAIALLDSQRFSPGTVLVTVALYRFISVLAEIVGAALGTRLWRERSG
ncbi:YbhN family protein [Pannus brasiliensis CCIBt3594]|uniref:YbhN family protein n=1 Tax=Pannus brasiliensis CCIBt3594 TaxID=1427578 RepID=A0AAW9QU23_9CHRO